MNYKLEGAIRRNRKNFIICAILWVVLTIVFVSPFSYSVFQAQSEGAFNLAVFLSAFGKYNKPIWSNRRNIF